MKVLSAVWLLPTLAAGSVLTQTDWSGGPGVPGPVTGWDAAFGSSGGLAWLSIPGRLGLSSEPLSTPVRHDVSLTYAGCYCADVGDVNGDGLNDIVATAFNGDALKIWLADGQGGWSVSTVAGLAGALGCDLGDIEGDGDLDILLTTYTPGSVRVFENLGGEVPGWSETVLTTAIHGGHDVRAVDLDADGDTDIVASAAEDDLMMWWRNDGGSPVQWTQQTVGPMGYPCRFAVADYDGDGNLDIAAAGYELNLVGIWYGSGGPSPTWTYRVAAYTVVGAHGACARDIDGDGDLDLFIAAEAGSKVLWLRNDGGSPLTWTRLEISPFSGAACAESADIDGDGDYDLTGGSFGSGGAAWWENIDAGSSWEMHVLGTGLGTFAFAAPGDVDMDGDLDVVCCGFSSNRLCWFEATSFAGSGWLESSILDTSCQPQYASFGWTADVPPGGAVSVQFRSSDDPSGMGEWSAPFASPADISGQAHRYFQYRISLATGDPDVSPLLSDFFFGFDPEWIGEGGDGGLLLRVSGGNPCTGAVVLETGHPGGGSIDLAVFDVSGRTVARIPCTLEGGATSTVTVTGLPSGAYLVSARHSGGGSARVSICVVR